MGFSRRNAPRAVLTAAGIVAVALVIQSGTKPSTPAKPRTQTQSISSPQIVGAKKAAAQAIRRNNLGVAYMNQQRFAQAREMFEKASALDPSLFVARLNLGIALLNDQQFDAARPVLEEIVEKLPTNPRSWYNLGLLYKSLGDAAHALPAFQKAAQLNTQDADTQYFLGVLHAELKQLDQAIAAFERAMALNPFHVSAEFGLARAYQRANDMNKARTHLARFQHLTQERLGAPISLAYGDQGRYSLAEQVAPPAPGVGPPIPVKFTRVPASESGLPAAAEGEAGSVSGACFFDHDNDGRPDLLLLSGVRDGAGRLYRNVRAGRFVDVTRETKLATTGLATACAAGDFDNDGRTDLALSLLGGGVRLFRNQADGTFADVTRQAGIETDADHQSGLTSVDYDHDGDVDLYVTRPSRLWRNNGNGTFTDVTTATGFDDFAAWSAVATDFNNDRAIDLVLSGGDQPPAILLNPREGKFQTLRAWERAPSPEIVGAIVADMDNDGLMDLAFQVFSPAGLSVWRNVGGKRLVNVSLPDLHSARVWSAVPLDYDNDGWVDIGFLSEGSEGRIETRLLRNRGAAGFEDISDAVGISNVVLAEARGIQAFDCDGDGDTDLLVTQAGAPPALLRNDGGNRNSWIKLSLKGLADNKSAIGTKVEVFAGSLYQKFEVRSPNDLLIGLGPELRVDIVRLLWPTGVLQDEIELLANRKHRVTEIDRRGSSCPILFAWNGTQYEFIADMIGPGIVGHWVGPGQRNVSDPDEYLKVDGGNVRPRRGLLSFWFIEPMEEVVYLDRARLLAVDHPAQIAVYPNERFASAPPFPEFRVIPSSDARLPVGAWDDRGRDELPRITQRDRRYVDGFASLPFQGYAEFHWLELELGESNPHRPLRLLLHGFTDYFTATSMYAAHQAGVDVIVPYVEALDAQGRWVRVVDDMGFPAGLARTMVADLTGKLPPGAHRIRIVTNLKIYWDEVLIDSTPEPQAFRVSEVPLARAALHFIGYPHELRGNPAGDVSYSFHKLSATGPYARAAGNYTRQGDVKDLLGASDDQFAIFGSGEGIHLDFDPRGLPPLPPGWVRDYFFHADGFAKDMDFYAAHPFTVEPLPYHTRLPYPYPDDAAYPSDEPYVRYQLDYNTRQLSGRMPPSLRFAFSPRR